MPTLLQECEVRTAKCSPAIEAARAEIRTVAELADRMLLQYKASDNLLKQWPASGYRDRAISETQQRLRAIHNLISTTTWGQTNLQNFSAKYEGSNLFAPAWGEPAPPPRDQVQIDLAPATVDLKTLGELLPEVAATIGQEYATQAPLHNRWSICLRTVVDSARQGLEVPNCWDVGFLPQADSGWSKWLLWLAVGVFVWWFFLRK